MDGRRWMERLGVEVGCRGGDGNTTLHFCGVLLFQSGQTMVKPIRADAPSLRMSDSDDAPSESSAVGRKLVPATETAAAWWRPFINLLLLIIPALLLIPFLIITFWGGTKGIGRTADAEISGTQILAPMASTSQWPMQHFKNPMLISMAITPFIQATIPHPIVARVVSYSVCCFTEYLWEIGEKLASIFFDIRMDALGGFGITPLAEDAFDTIMDLVQALLAALLTYEFVRWVGIKGIFIMFTQRGMILNIVYIAIAICLIPLSFLGPMIKKLSFGTVYTGLWMTWIIEMSIYYVYWVMDYKVYKAKTTEFVDTLYLEFGPYKEQIKEKDIHLCYAYIMLSITLLYFGLLDCRGLAYLHTWASILLVVMFTTMMSIYLKHRIDRAAAIR